MKAVVFDLDGTLYDERAVYPAGEAAAAALAEERFGVPRQDFLAAAKRAFAWQFSAHPERPGGHSRHVRFQRALEEFGKPPTGGFALAERYWETILAAMVPYPEAAPLLRDLRSAGIRTGVGTNMTGDKQLAKIERLGLADLFDFVVSSEEADAEKPAPSFFALVAEKAGCAPEEILFCGDNLERDARGAARAGMHAAWLRTDPAATAADAPDVPSVASLAELRAFLPEVSAR